MSSWTAPASPSSPHSIKLSFHEEPASPKASSSPSNDIITVLKQNPVHEKTIDQVFNSYDTLALPSRLELLQTLHNDSSFFEAIIQYFSAPKVGQSSDRVCRWLYELYAKHGNDAKLADASQNLVLSTLPILIYTWLTRQFTSPSTSLSTSTSGITTILMAIYNMERERIGGPIYAVKFSLPDLSQPSLYHAGFKPTATNPITTGRLTAGILAQHERKPSSIPPQQPPQPQQSQSQTHQSQPLPTITELTSSSIQTLLHVLLQRYHYTISSMSLISRQIMCFMLARLSETGVTSSEMTRQTFMGMSWKWTQAVDSPSQYIPLCVPVLQSAITIATYCATFAPTRMIARLTLHRIHERATDQFIPELLLPLSCIDDHVPT